ncbi:putative Acid phosphatase [Lupinus albus]|uniref:Putative Acid phosphatase n=1 Tax=Lupinus albus TaxID=3870 RepID=A0A6A4NMY9_LUPAL|nr:putative Acid phosphatase [Lupinus albus]
MGFRSLNSLVFLFLISGFFKFNVVYSYTRPPPGEIIFTEHVGTDEFPQQVHISKVGKDRMRISWITKRSTPSVVYYGLTQSTINLNATGNVDSYKYLRYRSGDIHDVVIGPLQPNTVYHYQVCSCW